MMPFITSQFLKRKVADRSDVIPKGSTNLALTGQFVEVPDDCVFTMEYSVRSAQMAVFKLLNLTVPTSEQRHSRRLERGQNVDAVNAVVLGRSEGALCWRALPRAWASPYRGAINRYPQIVEHFVRIARANFGNVVHIDDLCRLARS